MTRRRVILEGEYMPSRDGGNLFWIGKPGARNLINPELEHVISVEDIPEPELGLFDPKVDYPVGSVVVNMVKGGAVAIRLVNEWRVGTGGGLISVEMIDHWDDPQVVYLGPGT